jgi:hypothetical protein
MCSPFRQDPIGSFFLVIAFINNLLDGDFPWFKAHRLAAVASVVEGLFRLCGKGIGLGDSHGGRKDVRLATSL